METDEQRHAHGPPLMLRVAEVSGLEEQPAEAFAGEFRRPQEL